jgi:predicted nucleic acid-binding protein
MKKTLLDASSAILLYKADLFEELTKVYQVFVTRSVLEELTRKKHHGTETFLSYASLNKIKVTDLENGPPVGIHSEEGMNSLDQGEFDTIKCFLAGKHDFIITDDGRAAKYCNNYGLSFINALLFPRLLYFADFISLQESNDKMNVIIINGRYSSPVIEWARKCPKESLFFAIPGPEV